MLLSDKIYGSYDIRETVLLELIHAKPIQRLKKINQAGASQYIFPWKDTSRYDHSIGVMLLLRKYGGSIIEQIAGLLHDVPHTAFSHVIDFVFENEHHEYHERFHEVVINNSEIKNILKIHGITQKVVHPENYNLLEKNIPDLCADRIDYALRDHFSWKRDLDSIIGKLSGLVVQKGEFMFANQVCAEAFARDYLIQDEQVWAHPKEAACYVILAQAISHALDKHILKHQDLYSDDETVLTILKTSHDPYILKKLAYLTPTFQVKPATKDHYHLYIKTKIRYVDPKVIIGNQVKRLSELSQKYKKLLDKHIKQGKRGWYLFINNY